MAPVQSQSSYHFLYVSNFASGIVNILPNSTQVVWVKDAAEIDSKSFGGKKGVRDCFRAEPDGEEEYRPPQLVTDGNTVYVKIGKQDSLQQYLRGKSVILLYLKGWR